MAQIITTLADLEAMVEDYLQFEAFAFDVETLGTRPPLFEKDKPALDWRTNHVFWVSFAGPGRSDVLPLGHPKGDLLEEEYSLLAPAAECPAPKRCKQCSTGREPKMTKGGKPSKARVRHDISALFGPPPEQLTPEEAWPVLARLFLSPTIKVGHNLKFDVKSTAKYLPGGKPMPGPFRCTDIGWRLENENHQSYRLGDVTERTLDWKYDKSLGKAGVQNFAFNTAATYARCDAVAAWLGHRELMRRLRKQGDELVHLFEVIEMRTLAAVINMEMAGAPVDVEGIRRMEESLRGRLAELQVDIEDAYGDEINLNADAQVRRLVYEKLGFKPYLFTEKAQEPATSKAALEKFAYKDPRAENKTIKNRTVANILEWQETHKLWSTFAVPLLAYAEAGDGRIYASFDQLGARTGRFSCREPNLQQIPVRRGKEVRDLFIAPPGYVLVVSDYSQVELRVLAHFTQDPMLLKAYREDLDLHEMTARGAYKIPEGEEVPTKKRSLAKNVNFCVPMDTQALTIEGWKSYAEIRVGDVVLGDDEGVLRWTKVTDKHFFQNCELVRMKSGGFEAVSTPNHRWLGTKRVDTGKGGRVEKSTVFTTEQMGREHSIRLSAPAYTPNYLDVSVVDAAVIAWLHTDGSIVRSVFTGAPAQAGGAKVQFRGVIFQSKPEGLVHLRWLLANVPHRERVRPDGKMVEFHLDPAWLRDLWERAELDEQTLEQFVIRLGHGERQAFVDAAWRAEGWMNGATKTMAQNRGPVCDAMRTAAALLGHYVTTTSNGVYKGKENVNLSLCRPKVTGQRMKRVSAGRGDAWCISTGLGSWVMRQGDRIMLTGNSMAYGGTAWTIMTRYEVPEDEAELVVDGFYNTYKKVKPWKDRMLKTYRGRGRSKVRTGRHEDPYAHTICGRRRRLPDLLWPKTSDPDKRKGVIRAAERQAINAQIQGSAGDMAKLAMVELDQRLAEVDGKLIMMVHDELVTLVPEARAAEGVALVQQCMEDVGATVKLTVPLIADAKTASKWGDAK